MTANKKTQNLVSVSKAILLLIIGAALYAIFQPIFTPIGTTICQDFGQCIPHKPFVAVVLAPGNLTETNQTIYLENPQNLTATSFAFYISSSNSSDNISAYTGGGNVNVTYPYGKTAKGRLYTEAHNIANGDIGIIDVTMNAPAKINVTMVSVDTNDCVEDLYFSPLNITENPYAITKGTMTLRDVGNCPWADIYNHPYTTRGLIVINGG